MNSLKIRRIQAALAAINAHTAAKGNAEELAVSEDRSHVDDLLADLMHYCAQSEIDFDFHLSVARGHFKAETEAAGAEMREKQAARFREVMEAEQ